MDVHVQKLDTIEWKDALVVVAFPSTGSAASIAGHYLRQHLDLPLVGSIFAESQMPLVAVHNGIATSPVRIFGGETECVLEDGPCPRLYLVVADLILDPVLMRHVAARLLDEAIGARLVLCLDAVVRDEGDDTPDVFSVTAEPTTTPLLKLEGVEPLAGALLAGMTAEILLKGSLRSTPSAALVVEATHGIPDGRAGAALIQAVGRLLPNVPLDLQPLMDEALKLEEEVRKMQKDAESSQNHPKQLGTFV